MKKTLWITPSLLALSTSVVAFLSTSQPIEASATTTTSYVADTSNTIAASGLVSGAKYLFCQYAANTSAYEIMNGATTSVKQIPFLNPHFSSETDLQAGASSLANCYVTLTLQSGSNWFIQRNNDNQYLVSNGSSDLVFSSSSVYSSTNRSYFVPLAGSSNKFVRFHIDNDTGLYLGTKAEGAYFDTWHDGASVANKDFILYRVYDQTEEATNFAQSFNTDIGGVCSSSGDTVLSNLETQWSSKYTLWSNLSTAAKNLFVSTAASSSTSASLIAQCKAKYLYILDKYPSDSNINDFMGIRPQGANESEIKGEDQSVIANVIIAIFLTTAIAFVTRLFSKKRVIGG
jgi:hypothetical protein